LGRHQKTGLDYFPTDVNFPNDKKIQGLIGRMGPQAVFVYQTILCKIYEVDGYYVNWDEDNLLTVSRATWCTQEYVDDVIVACMEKELFSAELYAEYGVLTSAGVQRRYLTAIKERIRKMKQAGLQLNLRKSIWLLSAEETRKLKIEMGFTDGTTTAGADEKANEEERFFQEKSSKEKQSKEEKRKEEESKADKSSVCDVRARAWEGYPEQKSAPCEPAAPVPAAPHTHEAVGYYLSDEEYEELVREYGEEAVQNKIAHLKDWVAERGYFVKYGERKLRAWLSDDTRKEKLRREEAKQAAPQMKQTSAHMYDQRTYTDTQLEELLYTDIDHLNDCPAHLP